MVWVLLCCWLLVLGLFFSLWILVENFMVWFGWLCWLVCVVCSLGSWCWLVLLSFVVCWLCCWNSGSRLLCVVCWVFVNCELGGWCLVIWVVLVFLCLFWLYWLGVVVGGCVLWLVLLIRLGRCVLWCWWLDWCLLWWLLWFLWWWSCCVGLVCWLCCDWWC